MMSPRKKETKNGQSDPLAVFRFRRAVNSLGKPPADTPLREFRKQSISAHVAIAACRPPAFRREEVR